MRLIPTCSLYSHDGSQEYCLHAIVRASLEVCFPQDGLKSTKGCRHCATVVCQKRTLGVGVSPSLSSFLPV